MSSSHALALFALFAATQAAGTRYVPAVPVSSRPFRNPTQEVLPCVVRSEHEHLRREVGLDFRRVGVGRSLEGVGHRRGR